MKLKPIKVQVNDKDVVFWESPITLNELVDHAEITMSDEWRNTDGKSTIAISNGTKYYLSKTVKTV